MASDLLEKGHVRQALFFAHLAVEKALKALVVRETKGIPPKIHNLLRLSELGKVDMDRRMQETARVLERFCMAGRYPQEGAKTPSKKRAAKLFNEAKVLVRWLTEQ